MQTRRQANRLSTAIVLMAGIALVTMSTRAAAQSMAASSDEADRIEDSLDVLRQLTTAPDERIPQHLIDRAEAIVVIPSLIKGGFIVGAKHGTGVMTVHDDRTGEWSEPGFLNMTGASIGWQIGAEAVDLVLLVMNEEGVTELLEDRFTLGGNASIAAGPVGRSADAATDVQLDAQILAYSRSKGLFAGATLEGAALHADDDANARFYGPGTELEDVLTGSVARVPDAAARFVSAVSRIADTRF